VDIDTTRTYSATTDQSGGFSIGRVAPDDYKLLIRPSSGVLTAEWFDDKSSFAAGDMLTVRAGETVSDLNIELGTAGGSVSGTVTDGTTAVPGVQAIVRDADKPVTVGAVVTWEDGTYRFAHLPAGPVKLFFNADLNFLARASEHYSDKASFGTADPVTVTEGQETGGRDAVLGPAPALDVSTDTLLAGPQFAPYSAALQASCSRASPDRQQPTATASTRRSHRPASRAPRVRFSPATASIPKSTDIQTSATIVRGRITSPIG
jgi:hypothetical protein